MRWRRLRLAGYAGGLLLGVVLVLTYGAMEVSSTPAFCGSCHIMEPYFESWRDSSHDGIGCVDCHIPPGVTAELRKKYEALSMIARYFTGTYGTNPWAEVDDASCLECHERRLLAGAEVFGGVLFDHRPHLTELRRGKRLRCTSCHSQIVQGSHITVTSTSCVLCHFKDQPVAAGTARCTLCHQMGRSAVPTSGDPEAFNHADAVRLGMACEACHAPPPAGAGGVPRERCVTCHNDPVRLAEYGDGDLLHQTHVTDHKVECTHCHLEIEHGARRHPAMADGECAACHGARHGPQQALYAGSGGRGVEPQPDAMFLAGVRCEGCHGAHLAEAGEASGEVACMSCHGPGYRQLFRGWRQTLGERTAGLRGLVDRAGPGLAGRAEMADARANLELVERGAGIHNVPYSLALLDAGHRQLNEARRAAGLGALAKPWPEAPFESPCLECHAGIETRSETAFGLRFSHRPHVVSSALECATCHRSHEERVATGAAALRLASAANCSECHHSPSRQECLDCHGDVLDGAIAVDLGEFDHAMHVEDMELACADCHGAASPRREPAAAVCADCH